MFARVKELARRAFDQLTRAENTVDLVRYVYRRQRWMLRPDLMVRDLSPVDIDRPVFLVGASGGGLTLLARILRRAEGVVTVSGGSDYWTGADEMYVAMAPILPWQISGEPDEVPWSSIFGAGRRRGWAFASDTLFPFYALDDRDVTPQSAEGLRKAIRICIALNGADEHPVRFLDKSQPFGLKIPYLRTVLEENGPKFVGVVRNPYALCYRATQTTSLSGLRCSHVEKLRIATQTWRNLYSRVASDCGDDLLILRFEDFLADPADWIRKVCDHCELPYSQQMLPAADDDLPVGTLRRGRWHPLRRDVNAKWLSQISNEDKALVREQCGDIAEQYGYQVP